MPPVKKVNKTEELFNVNGLSIKKNAIYKVENRFDASAPSGFQNERTTKLPSSDIGNTIGCPFTVANQATGEGRYNTGLYEGSACYKQEDPKRVTEKLKMIKDYIIDPFEKLKGQLGILSQSNEKFWDDYRVELYDGRYFNTADPEDILQLFIAMLAGELAPENDQGNPKYKHADFVIVDKAKERTNRTRKAVTVIDAMGRFFILLSENPQKLFAVLKYVGIANVTDKADSDTVKTMFYAWLDQNDRNSEAFDKILTDCEDKTFEEVVYLHATLKKVTETGKGLQKNSVGDYMYNGVPLGKDLKSVARNLVQTLELGDIKAQMLEEFTK